MTTHQQVELRVDGVRTNTYWIKDGVIVVSDWGGAKSFAGVATEVQSGCAERS